jgi:hypothetical protein
MQISKEEFPTFPIITLLVILGSWSQGQGQTIPSFALYNSDQMDNATFSFQSSIDRPDLEATWQYFDNTTKRSLCARGLWIFYFGVENYELGGPFNPSPTVYDHCEDRLWFHESYYFGSARLAGIEGESRMNLYSGVNLTASAETYYANTSSISGNFSSLVLVGNSSVQLYTEPSYAGSSYCIERASGKYTELRNLAYMGIQPGDVRSIKFGCTGDAKMIKSR